PPSLGAGTSARPATTPWLQAAVRVHVVRDLDLLLLGGEVGARGVLAAAVAQPRPDIELQAAVVAVAGVDVPALARLALRDGIPVDTVRADRRGGGAAAGRLGLGTDVHYGGDGRGHRLARHLDRLAGDAVGDLRVVVHGDLAGVTLRDDLLGAGR